MTFRARLTIALVAVAAVPLAILGVGVFREMNARLSADASRRVQAVESAVSGRISERLTADRERLTSLAADLAADSRFRIALTSGADRRWLLDWAPSALKAAGFAVLQVQDADGRVLSSGQFRNAYDRVDSTLVQAIKSTPAAAAVVNARTPGGSVLALVTYAEFSVRGVRYTVIGGAGLDSARVAALSTDNTVLATLDTGEARLGERVATALPYVGEVSGLVGEARFALVADPSPALALRASVTRWLLLTLGFALLVGVLIATPLGRVIAAPIVALGERAARAERAAATGELARQVNHDIKNGLAIIRNVLRHFDQALEPEELAAIYKDRKGTLDSGVAYLDELARNYARLSPVLTQRPADPRPVVVDIAKSVTGASVDLRLPETLPAVRADAVVLRRVLDNLVSNAVDSLDGRPGWIRIAGEPVRDGTGPRVRFTISDTGRGMSTDELRRAFSDFYTTKPTGTGLGLTVVRRLLTDVGGSVAATSQPGLGSTFTVEIPIADSGVKQSTAAPRAP